MSTDFVDFARTVFGDVVDAEGLWAEVAKMNPGPSDVHSPGVSGALVRRRRRVTKRRELTPEEKRERLQRNIARGSNALGLTAGTMAIGATMRDERLRHGGRAARSVYRAGEAMPKPITNRLARMSPRARAAAAMGAVAAQGSNVAGDVVVSRTLPKGEVDKGMREMTSGALRSMRRLSTAYTGGYRQGSRARPSSFGRFRPAASSPAAGPPSAAASRGTAGRAVPSAASTATSAPAAAPAAAAARTGKAESWTRRGARARRDVDTFTGTTTGKLAMGGAGAAAGVSLLSRRQEQQSPVYYGKADDVEWAGTFAKLDEDKRLAFGWASVVKINGEPVVDRQGDYVGINDIEDAAYVYVEKSRVGGHMHQRIGGKDRESLDSPHHVADLVESMVFTPEKIEQLGLPRSFPVGWWVGYRVFDDDVWDKAKSGELTGFSIHGKGIRKAVSPDELVEL